MNILHITAHLGGGAGKAIVGMASRRIRDCVTKIILLDQPDRDLKLVEAKNNSIEVVIAPNGDTMNHLILEADIIILNWWTHPKMVHFLKNYPEIPCRIIIWNHINGCTYPYLPADFLKKFEKIFFTSAYSYENDIWTREERHNICKKSEVIYGMGDFQPITILPKKEYKIKKEFRVGYVGTLNYGKLTRNFVKYCEAAAEIITDIKFILVGDIDEAVVNDILNSAIKDKFDIQGFSENPEKYYPTFDAFGYLLNRENYATTENSLIEAMSYGIPIIVKNNGVESCIIHDGINGYVIRNRKEYADELFYLRNNEWEREKIGKQARNYVVKTYSEESNFHQFYGTCLNVINKPKKKYKFTDILGKEPIEWFLYFANKDGEIFKDYLNKKSNMNKTTIKNCKPIFKEKSKSSVLHFSGYFPKDKNLKGLAEILNIDREINE